MQIYELSVLAEGQTLGVGAIFHFCKTFLSVSLTFHYGAKECAEQEWNPSNEKYTRLKTSPLLSS